MSKKLKIDSGKKKKTPWSIRTKNMLLSDRNDGTRIELFSNCELNVEGCRGVEEYTDTYIRIRVKKGMITVTGSMLDISVYEADGLTVKGKIMSIEFCV